MQSVGRYVLCDEIASGGMASVHLGRVSGAGGFSRTVAIKRLHPHLAKERDFVAMFLDEARLASRIRHANVVPTLDVVAEGDELFLVMEYVHGESLACLARASAQAGRPVPPRVAVSVLCDVLSGLHAAHTATDTAGAPLLIVHRDVSPQNVLVGLDGVARVVDFGVAHALGRLQTTRDGQIKGKLAYLAPEQFDGRATCRTDVYAASIVLWELLTGERLFVGDEQAQVVKAILAGEVAAPSAVAEGAPKELDAIVLRGLARAPEDRYPSARDMAEALRRTGLLASPAEVGEWVTGLAGGSLAARAEQVSAVERASSGSLAAASAPGGAEPTVTTIEPPAPRARPRSASQHTAHHDAAGAPKAGVAPLPPIDATHGAVTASGTPSTPKRRPALALTLLGAGALVLGVLLLMIRPWAPSSVPSAPTPPVPSSASVETPAPSAVAPQASADPSVPDAAAPPRSPVASQAPPAKPPVVAPVPRRPPPPTTAAQAKPDCSPPYREVLVGSNVRRVPKPECL